MKRFYCTVCQRMKRVQRWPVILENRDSDNPALRLGECNRHTMTMRTSYRPSVSPSVSQTKSASDRKVS